MKPVQRVNTPGRNEKCPCNSGLKAKKCCLEKIKIIAQLSDEQKREVLTNLVLEGRVQ